MVLGLLISGLVPVCILWCLLVFPETLPPEKRQRNFDFGSRLTCFGAAFCTKISCDGPAIHLAAQGAICPGLRCLFCDLLAESQGLCLFRYRARRAPASVSKSLHNILPLQYMCRELLRARWEPRILDWQLAWLQADDSEGIKTRAISKPSRVLVSACVRAQPQSRCQTYLGMQATAGAIQT